MTIKLPYDTSIVTVGDILKKMSKDVLPSTVWSPAEDLDVVKTYLAAPTAPVPHPVVTSITCSALDWSLESADVPAVQAYILGQVEPVTFKLPPKILMKKESVFGVDPPLGTPSPVKTQLPNSVMATNEALWKVLKQFLDLPEHVTMLTLTMRHGELPEILLAYHPKMSAPLEEVVTTFTLSIKED